METKHNLKNFNVNITICPGFGQDRVNFHWNPGRSTAGRADPTWPNRTGYSIPWAFMLGSSGGGVGQRELTRGSGARCDGSRGERLCCAVCFILYIPFICIVVVPVPFVCCSVKLPLSRPTSCCLFLSILLRTPAGGGAAAWRLCCQRQPNHSTIIRCRQNISNFFFSFSILQE